MSQPYPPNQPHHQQPQYAPPPPAPVAKRRKVWPWVLLALVGVPVLFFVACTAMVGGAVSAVNDARQGGSVALGETFTYQSGLGISAAVPTSYTPRNQFDLAAGEVGYETMITITNGTSDPVGATLITKNATVNGQPAQEIFGEGTFATQDIAPGQQLQIPFRFKTPGGLTGPLQIAVTDTFNEPVFFNGAIG